MLLCPFTFALYIVLKPKLGTCFIKSPAKKRWIEGNCVPWNRWLLGKFWNCKKASRLILVSALQRGWKSPRLGLRAGNVRPRAPGPQRHRSCSPAPTPHPKAPGGAGSLPLPLRRLGPLSPRDPPPTGRRRQHGGHTCDFSRSRLRAWSPLRLPLPPGPSAQRLGSLPKPAAARARHGGSRPRPAGGARGRADERERAQRGRRALRSGGGMGAGIGARCGSPAFWLARPARGDRASQPLLSTGRRSPQPAQLASAPL